MFCRGFSGTLDGQRGLQGDGRFLVSSSHGSWRLCTAELQVLDDGLPVDLVRPLAALFQGCANRIPNPCLGLRKEPVPFLAFQ